MKNETIYTTLSEDGSYVVDENKTNIMELSEQMVNSLNPVQKHYLAKHPDELEKILKGVLEGLVK